MPLSAIALRRTGPSAGVSAPLPAAAVLVTAAGEFVPCLLLGVEGERVLLGRAQPPTTALPVGSADGEPVEVRVRLDAGEFELAGELAHDGPDGQWTVVAADPLPEAVAGLAPPEPAGRPLAAETRRRCAREAAALAAALVLERAYGQWMAGFLGEARGLLAPAEDGSTPLQERTRRSDALALLKQFGSGVAEATVDQLMSRLGGRTEVAAMLTGDHGSGLSLVEKEEYEQWLVLKRVATRLVQDTAGPLAAITDTLAPLTTGDVTGDGNPAGPWSLSAAFNEVVNAGGWDDPLRLQLKHTFAHYLEKRFVNWVEGVRARLVGVSLPQDAPRSTGQETAPAGRADEQPVSAAAPASVPPVPATGDVAGAVQALTARVEWLSRALAVDRGGEHRSALSAAQFDQLVSRVLAEGGGAEGADAVGALCEHAARGREGGLTPAQRGSLGAVQSMLSRVGETRGVHGSVADWVGQLWQPLARAAMVDGALQAGAEHPMTRALDLMNRLASPFGPTPSVRSELERLVSRLHEGADGSMLEQFVAELEELDRSAEAGFLAAAARVQGRRRLRRAGPRRQEGEAQARTAADREETAARPMRPPAIAPRRWEQALLQLRTLEAGDWLSLSDDSGTDERFRLAAVDEESSLYTLLRPDGTRGRELYEEELARAVVEGTAEVFPASASALVERLRHDALVDAETHIARAARLDPLTGLNNRREFERLLRKRVYESVSGQSRHTACLLDLDLFRIVNSSRGYEAGDRLLKQVAGLLSRECADFAECARLGSDEFGLLFVDTPLDQGLPRIEALLQRLGAQSFDGGEEELSVTASLGAVEISADTPSVDLVFDAIDSACRLASESGGNQVQVSGCDDARLSERRRAMDLASRIGKIIRGGQLYLRCQRIEPLSDAAGALPHYEVLLGLQDEVGGQGALGTFITAAERYGRMAEVDRWVAHSVFTWMCDSRSLLDGYSGFSINLSGNSVRDERFLRFLLAELKYTGVPAEKVVFEVTETVAIGDLRVAAKMMDALKARGCRFALDDFGVGMSSFAYLKALPVDYLKIDGGFVKNIVDDAADFAVVKSINDIGHHMGKRTVAEFVASAGILEKCRAIGVDYAQGFHVEKPRRLLELG